jgi:acetyltransferase-like isoleucine patch superfamily enzyme
MASTIPNVILGLSPGIVAVLLETLAVLDVRDEITLVENIAADESIPFLHPDVPVDRVPLDRWSFVRGRDRLCFGTSSVKGKTWIFGHFAARAGFDRNDFAALIHPRAVVASTSRIGNGCYVEPGTVIAPFSELGFGVSISRSCSVGHHTRVGEFCRINPGCHISGFVTVGKGVQIGAGAVIFDELTIGEGSIIGGGSVVTRDIPAGVIAFGNPCKVVRAIS